MSQSAPKTVILHRQYTSFEEEGMGNVDAITEKLIFHFPTVYVVHAMSEHDKTITPGYVVYVGETNHIMERTLQHLKVDPVTRSDWMEFSKRLSVDSNSVWQYVIGNPHFNKSLTLDVENRLMHYLLGAPAVRHLNNRRSNAQGEYYTRDEFNRIFNDIWLQLHDQNPELFPSEQIIRDSALFKASPFHELTKDQRIAEETILSTVTDALNADSGTRKRAMGHVSQLIVVEGAAGTGKTVLLSHLFYRMETELGLGTKPMTADDEDDEDLLDGSNGGEPVSAVPSRGGTGETRRKAYILVNHHEQKNVYNQIATKLNLQTKSDEVVLLPSQFINKFSEHVLNAEGKSIGRGIPDKPQGRADVVLIDEGHLLLTQGNQGYSGHNQLHDILQRAKVVVLVFDPKQILQTAQLWDKTVLGQLLGKDKTSLSEGDDIEEHSAANSTGTKSDDYGDNSANRCSETVADGQQSKTFVLRGDSYAIRRIRLNGQQRIAANSRVIDWIENFADAKGIDNLPRDYGAYDDDGFPLKNPYEIKVFDSPVDLFTAIQKKAKQRPDGVNGCGLSRVLATYDWKYSSKPKDPDRPDNYWNVELHRNRDGAWEMGLEKDGVAHNGAVHHGASEFSHPWNYQLTDPDATRHLSMADAWAEKPYTIDEIGSTFTIQGFDLNFAGVIIGPSVKYRDGKIVSDKLASANRLATRHRKGMGDDVDEAENLLRNELNVLLKRGVHGLYLFAVDAELQKRLKEAIPTQGQKVR